MQTCHVLPICLLTFSRHQMMYNVSYLNSVVKLHIKGTVIQYQSKEQNQALHL